MPNNNDLINFKGSIMEALPRALFRVQLESQAETPIVIIAHLSGKMRKNNIRCLVGDRVDVEMTPYDLTKGRIIYRYK